MSDCFYHTGRPSVTRCKQCGRPLCGECKIIGDSGIFCSDKCRQSFDVFKKRADEIEERRGKSSKSRGLLRFLVFIIIIVLLYSVARMFL